MAGTSDSNTGNAVMSKLRQLIANDEVGGWESAWKTNVTPWDAGQVQPPLHDLIKSGELDLPTSGGRALVPGCGKGYDALCIASSLGLKTLALDISETAVNSANDLLAKTALPDSVELSFEVKDFFTLSTSDDNRFDLVYDYTFFVAIPPIRRKEWGRQMAALVKTGGYLITLVFPLDPPQDIGPPFFVRPAHYVDVLGGGWERVIDRIPERSLETHKDRERLIVWKRTL